MTSTNAGNFDLNFDINFDENTQPQPAVKHVKVDRNISISEEDTKVFVDSMKNVNTQRKTKNDLRFFSGWLAEQQEFRAIEDIKPLDLDLLLARFFLSVRKINGEDYEPDTLKSFQSSFARKLSEVGYGHDILKSPAFKHYRDVLAAKRKELKGKGLGNRKNRADPFTNEELNILWDQGLLGAGTYASCKHKKEIITVIFTLSPISVRERGISPRLGYSCRERNQYHCSNIFPYVRPEIDQYQLGRFRRIQGQIYAGPRQKINFITSYSY